MTGISEIEIAVAKLSRQDLSAFRDWFQEFDADAWDRQLDHRIIAIENKGGQVFFRSPAHSPLRG